MHLFWPLLYKNGSDHVDANIDLSFSKRWLNKIIFFMYVVPSFCYGSSQHF